MALPHSATHDLPATELGYEPSSYRAAKLPRPLGRQPEGLPEGVRDPQTPGPLSIFLSFFLFLVRYRPRIIEKKIGAPMHTIRHHSIGERVDRATIVSETAEQPRRARLAGGAEVGDWGHSIAERGLPTDASSGHSCFDTLGYLPDPHLALVGPVQSTGERGNPEIQRSWRHLRGLARWR